MRLKYRVITALERGCETVDQLPAWTSPLIGRWLGCPRGLARWSCVLADRWDISY